MAQNIGVINTLIAEFKQRMQGSIYTAHSTVVPTEARSLHPCGCNVLTSFANHTGSDLL